MMSSTPVDPRFALESANQSELVQKKLSIDAMRKRVSGGVDEEAKLRDACEGFESIFLQKMWEQMRKNVKKEGYLHSKDEEAYQSMFDVELAKKMASAGGIGLADMLYEQLGQKLHNASKTTGLGSMRTPLPIDPAVPRAPEVKETAATPDEPPTDLYSEVPEEPATRPEPPKSPLEAALEELAASRDPALDPANMTYPMFDLQTGTPMNPVAEKMREESEPKREFDLVPLPERVSAPGKAKPSNALRSVNRSARHSRKMKGMEPEDAAQSPQPAQIVPGMRNAQALDNARAAQAQTAQVRAAHAADAAQASESWGTHPAPALNVPPARAAQEPAQPAGDPRPANETAEPAPALTRSAWPVRGEVISAYGRTDTGWNTGVSLAARPDSPVVAPMTGTVAFVGRKDGVGQMVLDHGDGLTSVYSNVTSTLSPGDVVPAGTEFAKVSAGAGAPAAHNAGTAGGIQFEVRRGELAINPESILG